MTPDPMQENEQELAIDLSRGKEGAAFGRSIISEQDVEDLLSPTDLSGKHRRHYEVRYLMQRRSPI